MICPTDSAISLSDKWVLVLRGLAFFKSANLEHH